jgi:radical SAM protein with 4Fe4S-binding SPASM domain
VWEVTLACDLACHHCASRAGRPRADELDTRESLDLVAQLAALGVREVTLIGGEAYLRDDWLTILAAIRDHGMLPTMTTGGRQLTAERARAARAAGLEVASVSIDGEEETHDRLRNLRGSHAAAMRALANLRDAGVTPGVNTQINRASYRELPDILERVARAGAVAWQLQLTVPMGRAADVDELALQPYDLLEVFPTLGAVAARCEALGVALTPGNNVGYFGPFERVLRGGMLAGHGGSCGAGVLSIGVEADGTIKGCPSLETRDWGGGNIRSARLVDIWERAEALRYNRDDTTNALWGFCATCYYADECRGGCMWAADALLGRPGNNPWCHHRALEQDKRGLRERLVRVAPPAGEPFDRARWELVEEPIPAVLGRDCV